MQDPKTVLAKAADFIKQHGHHKGGYGDPDIGFCAAGAVWYACTGFARGTGFAPAHLVDLYVAALELLPMGGGVVAWNDNPRTTKDDVIQVLRKAAQEEKDAQPA